MVGTSSFNDLINLNRVSILPITIFNDCNFDVADSLHDYYFTSLFFRLS